jgi:exopolyphosphatase / guanosine-5'-triphosphate,3'-diphosphate pyrophosphatase
MATKTTRVKPINHRYAILDLGTNTFHLLIFSVEKNGQWRKLLHRRITVKLGQGGIHNNEIADAPFRRGIAALKKFREYMDEYGVSKVKAFGTAALRNASNGPKFIRDAKKLYRIPIELISGDAEAQLILKGVSQAVPMTRENVLIMDIGGGSVEFIIANDSKIHYKQSFKLGAALLLEQFRPSDPITSKQTAKLKAHFETVLTPLMKAIAVHHPVMLIGSAGSFETFASMIRNLFPEAGSHYGKKSHPILLKHFNQLHRNLIRSTRQERKQMPGLIKMRVDMIVMASMLLKFVLDKSNIKEMKMSAYSLKEGGAGGMVK